jgi:hypothetical protein
MMPFHNQDHICGGNDILVDCARRSGIEPGGRDLKTRPSRKQRFRRRTAQPVAGSSGGTLSFSNAISSGWSRSYTSGMPST